jgi:hypothetical protein
MVKDIIKCFFNTVSNENDLNVDKEKFMGGWKISSIKRTRVILIIVHFVKYYIFMCRNRKKMPSIVGLMYEFGGLERNMERSENWGVNFREGIGNISGILTR